jgi:hypothetical protein
MTITEPEKTVSSRATPVARERAPTGAPSTKLEVMPNFIC